MRKTLPILSLCLFSLITLPLSAQIFKWVDKNGSVQFSDTDPELKNVQQIEVRPPVRSANNDAGEKRRLSLVASYESQLAEARHQPASIEIKIPKLALSSNHCNHAVVQEGILELQMPIYQTPDGNFRPDWRGDTYDGPRKYVQDSNRSQLLAEAEAVVVNVCDSALAANEKAAIFNRWVDSEYCLLSIEQLTAAKRERSRSSSSRIEALQERVENCASASLK